MIIIQNPYVDECYEKSRLTCNILENNVQKQIWFEVQNEFAKYLCYERGDAFLIALIYYAMEKGHDIKSEVAITDELLYNINEYLIPTLHKSDKRLKNIKIEAPFAPRLNNAGAVGTGLSCGTDSFHAILNNIHSPFPENKLTHVCINNVGSFDVYSFYGNEEAQNVKNAIYKKAQNIANELNIPLIQTESNLMTEIPQNHLYTNTYSSMFAVFCLQKLWKTYFYASVGYGFEAFNLINNSTKDSGLYDLLTLNCFSNKNLRIYSEGGAKTKLEKIKFIADFDITQKHLHVCIKKTKNCGICSKCKRTILVLDSIGKLDKFKNVFDINYYKTHKNDYLKWLCVSHFNKDKMNEPTYQILKKSIPLHVKMLALLEFHKIFYINFEDENTLKIRFLIFSHKFKTRKNRTIVERERERESNNSTL